MTLLSATRVFPGRSWRDASPKVPVSAVLLLEAGGDDDVPGVRDALLWPSSLETERQWNLRAQPNSRLNGRPIPLNMGRAFGGSPGRNSRLSLLKVHGIENLRSPMAQSCPGSRLATRWRRA
jgi:hypothetical protein